MNKVVLPLMNVNRRTADGGVNITEPHQTQIFISSAGHKVSYAYEKMKQLMLHSIIYPHQAFVWGCDYRIPVKYGLIPANYVNEMKIDPTFDEESFALEYLSIWSASSAESWISYDRIAKYRCMVNTEQKAETNYNKAGNVQGQFYLIAVDVGRLQCETVATIFKVVPAEGHFNKKLVNIEVFPESLTFEHQAARIKELIERYNPKEVVIDGNGLTN